MRHQICAFPAIMSKCNMANGVGAFVQNAIEKTTPKSDLRISKSYVPHGRIVNKPHQNFLMLSSWRTSRNIMPYQSTTTLLPLLCYFCNVHC